MISGTPIRCPSGDDFTLGPLRSAAADLAIATSYPAVTRCARPAAGLAITTC
jgi:hypothetical protein